MVGHVPLEDGILVRIQVPQLLELFNELCEFKKLLYPERGA